MHSQHYCAAGLLQGPAPDVWQQLDCPGHMQGQQCLQAADAAGDSEGQAATWQVSMQHCCHRGTSGGWPAVSAVVGALLCFKGSLQTGNNALRVRSTSRCCCLHSVLAGNASLEAELRIILQFRELWFLGMMYCLTNNFTCLLNIFTD